MKKSVILFAISALATLLSGCELYNRGQQDTPLVDPYLVEFEATSLVGDYYGDYYGIGRGNYYIYLSDKGLSQEGVYLPHANYYIVDITADLNNFVHENVQIPSGSYTLDTENSLENMTFSKERSMYIATDANGEVIMNEPFESASMSIAYDGITLTAKIGDYTHVVTYRASPRVRNRSENGKHSTLTENRTLALINHTLYYYPCGDYYETGLDNWLLLVYPKNNEGDILQFDIMTEAGSDTLYGAYTIGNSSTANSIIKGVLTQYDGETYMEGSWYYTSDYTSMAPFADGTLNISDNGEGTTKIAFDLKDDMGHTINGEWSGVMELYPY